MRRDLRWGLLLAVLFTYCLCLTWERIELKEMNGRIYGLERELQKARSDESILRVAIDRECSYEDVLRLAHDRGMEAAQHSQRVLLPPEDLPVQEVLSARPALVRKAGLIEIAERVTQLLRENVAEARTPRLEAGDGPSAE
jgi:hypothetical protein